MDAESTEFDLGRDCRPDGGRAPTPGSANIPTLQSLRTLEVLTRRRRVGAAAAELGLTHAAVSQTVTRLEKQLSLSLFLKGSWGVEATAQCKNLVEAYLSASSTLERALNEVRDDQRYRILLPKTAWHWLSSAIGRLYPSTPELCFRVYQEDDPVDLGLSDFAIVAGGHAPPRGFEGAALYDERLIPVCSPAFARSARIETPASLARIPLLIARRDLWLSWFSRAGLNFEPNIAGPLFADSTLAMEAALQGQGVALCCTLAVGAAVSRGDLVAPIPVSASTERRLWAVWKDAPREPAVRVLHWLLAEIDARQSAPHVRVVEETVSARRDEPSGRRANLPVYTLNPWSMNENRQEIAAFNAILY